MNKTEDKKKDYEKLEQEDSEDVLYVNCPICQSLYHLNDGSGICPNCKNKWDTKVQGDIPSVYSYSEWLRVCPDCGIHFNPHTGNIAQIDIKREGKHYPFMTVNFYRPRCRKCFPEFQKEMRIEKAKTAKKVSGEILISFISALRLVDENPFVVYRNGIIILDTFGFIDPEKKI
ncbi:MAG: hypothetical protein ABIJ28_02075 [Patescibacteria group bacterium]